MNISDFATMTVAYNEEKLIGGLLKGIEDLHNLVLIGTPWRGKHIGFDKTEEIAKKMGAEIIHKNFDDQTTQRNYAMAHLQKKGFKYVLMFDADEYYLKEDVHKIIQFIIEHPADLYVAKNVRIYWKSWKWHFIHEGNKIAANTSKRFSGKRNITTSSKSLIRNEMMHHFSFNVSAEDMRLKAATREYGVMNEGWLQKHWDNWTPGNDSFREILPTKDIPTEILGRYIKSISGLYA